MLESHKKSTVLPSKKLQGILKTTILESLVVQKYFVSHVFMEDIYGMKCQLNNLHLVHFLNKKNMIKIGKFLC